jgi:hypothetical protein
MTEPIKTIADWIKRVEELETTFQLPDCWPFPIPGGEQPCHTEPVEPKDELDKT